MKAILLGGSTLTSALFAVHTIASAGTAGELRGRITAADSQIALGMAAVTLRSSTGTYQGTIGTDERGTFRFVDLPVGQYLVSASKEGYLPWYYGQVEAALRLGSLVSVQDGQLHEINIALPRASVVSGTIRESSGRPISHALVSVVERRIVAGEEVFRGGSSERTDERGEYRVIGLAPGSYIVAATPPPRETLSAREASVPTTRADVEWAQRQQQSGRTIIVEPPPAPAKPVLNGPAFFPSVRERNQATVLSLGLGEELRGVDITLPLEVTSRLAGEVAASGGTTPAVRVSLTSNRDVNEASIWVVGPKFSFPGLLPGRYTLRARTVKTGPDLQWGQREIIVAGENEDDVKLELREPLAVAGRVRFDFESASTAPSGNELRLTLSPTRLQSRAGGALPISGAVDGRGEVLIPGVVPDWYRATVEIPAHLSAGRGRMVVSSIKMGDRDVTATPFEIAATGIPPLAVTLTDKVGQVIGRIVDGSGRPSSEPYVILFPAEPGARASRPSLLKGPIRPASDGTFQFVEILPGEYLIAIVGLANTVDFLNQTVLEELAKKATRAMVGVRQTTSVELTWRSR